MLELQIAGRSFGKPVLGEVFATIERGDRICLLGPSGIGKTTLLNAIAGLDKALPQGAIIGRETLRVGYLFQEHRLLPRLWRTVYGIWMVVQRSCSGTMPLVSPA